MKTSFGKADLCELTDHYEAAIMHKSVLHVTWQDGQSTRETRLQPFDLQAHEGKEFLIANDESGKQVQICLDYVKSVREFPLTS